MKSLSWMVPNVDDFLSLEVEELAGVLLVHLNSCAEGAGGSGGVYQFRRIKEEAS